MKRIRFNCKKPYKYENEISKGQLAHIHKNLPEALDRFNKAIRINPQDPSGYDYRGSIRAEMGDFNSAILDFQRALILDPSYFLAINNINDVIDKFKEHFQIAIELDNKVEKLAALEICIDNTSKLKINSAIAAESNEKFHVLLQAMRQLRAMLMDLDNLKLNTHPKNPTLESMLLQSAHHHFRVKNYNGAVNDCQLILRQNSTCKEAARTLKYATIMIKSEVTISNKGLFAITPSGTDNILNSPVIKLTPLSKNAKRKAKKNEAQQQSENNTKISTQVTSIPELLSITRQSPYSSSSYSFNANLSLKTGDYSNAVLNLIIAQQIDPDFDASQLNIIIKLVTPLQIFIEILLHDNISQQISLLSLYRLQLSVVGRKLWTFTNEHSFTNAQEIGLAIHYLHLLLTDKKLPGLSVSPLLERLLLDCANLYADFAPYDLTIKYSSLAIQQNPACLQAYQYRAVAYTKLGKFALAAKDLEMVNPKSDEASIPELSFNDFALSVDASSPKAHPKRSTHTLFPLPKYKSTQCPSKNHLIESNNQVLLSDLYVSPAKNRYGSS